MAGFCKFLNVEQMGDIGFWHFDNTRNEWGVVKLSPYFGPAGKRRETSLGIRSDL